MTGLAEELLAALGVNARRAGSGEVVDNPEPASTRGDAEATRPLGCRQGERPHAPGLELHEQHDAAGDVVWVLTGRGEPVWSHSITAIDHAIRDRLTDFELIAADRWQLAPRLIVQAAGVDTGAPTRPLERRLPLWVLRKSNGKPNYRDADEANRYLRESGSFEWSTNFRMKESSITPWEEWIAAQNDPARVPPELAVVEPIERLAEVELEPTVEHPWRTWRPAESEAAQTAKRRAGRPCLLTDEQVEAAYREHVDGLSVSAVARLHWQEWGYASESAAAMGLHGQLKRRGHVIRKRQREVIAA